jgi:orotate phosphoribosyltransferase
MALPPYKTAFLNAALEGRALRLGSFELKSKRISPYFFNAGDFYRADLLTALAVAYANTIHDSFPGAELPFDVIFGPAYKGIPLATATTMALAQLGDGARYRHVEYSFDRKEAKDHGEGGSIVGAPLAGRRVLIIDDVVSAGTAKRQAIDKIRAEGGEVVGIIVALDRQETLPDSAEGKTAIGLLRAEYGIPIVAILTLDDIFAGLKGIATEDDLKRIDEYRAKYGARD